MDDQEQRDEAQQAPQRFTKAQLEEARGKSSTGELHFVPVAELGLEFIVRPPTAGEYKRFRSMLLDQDVNKRAGALEQLFRDCCLLPDPIEVQQALTKFPALAEDLGVECRRIAGAFQEVRAKKL